MHFHAVVWIDHRNAHVLGFGEGEPTRQLIRATGPSISITRRARSVAAIVTTRQPISPPSLRRLNDYREILVVGPAETRTEFHTYLAGHSPAIAKKS